MSGTPEYFASPDLYDRMYAPFTADIGIHVDAARAADGPVLEVCCGNGRLLIPIRQAGVDIEGLDFDEAMLEDLRVKLALRDLTAPLHHGDMRDFALPRRFARVFIGFNSFYHNLTQADQIATLVRCREHLAPGGTFAMMAFHPSCKRLAAFDGTPTPNIDYPLPDGGRLVVSDGIQPDRVEQVNRVRRIVEHFDAGGAVIERSEHTFQVRYCYKPEIELLLRVAGFTRWHVGSLISGYGGDRYLEPRMAEDGGVLFWEAWA